MKFRNVFIAIFCVAFALFSFNSNDRKLIVIDAGHGGNDHGAVSGDLKEKDIVRNIANQIVKANHDPNIEFFIIGENDTFIDMTERIKAINSLNADVVISLHAGFSPLSTTRGTTIYVSPKNVEFEKSKLLASKIIKGLSVDSSRKNEVQEGNLMVLKNANCAALSIEVGYISNADDVKMMLSESTQNSIASQILASLN